VSRQGAQYCIDAGDRPGETLLQPEDLYITSQDSDSGIQQRGTGATCKYMRCGTLRLVWDACIQETTLQQQITEMLD